MIKAAVEKGMKDIYENPHRGMRNLVDLGEMFASGQFQKGFFKAARKELENKESVYYKLVERVIENTNKERLTSFGMNLGYNCWTNGANQIREIEEKEGFNIPWCIFIDAGNHDSFLDIETFAGLVSQGRELGTYCYLINIDKEHPFLNELIFHIEAKSDCAFALFVKPDLLSAKTIQLLERVPNLLILIDIDSEDFSILADVSKTLFDKKMLFGGYTHYSDINKSLSQKAKVADKLEQPFLFLINTESLMQQFDEEAASQLKELRNDLKYPVLPIELCYDIAQIDCNISTQSCLTKVSPDGTVHINNDGNNAGNGDTYATFNIHKTSLKEILRVSAPK